MKRFHKFCITYQITDPFPVTEKLLCHFVAHLANDGLSPQTGKSYMAAIRNMQLSLGLPDPREQSSLPVLKRVLAGISRLRLNSGSPPRIRLPITSHIMRQLKVALAHSSHPEKVMLWAVACTAFFGFFRLGELLMESTEVFNCCRHLEWGDIAVDSVSAPTMVRVHLKQSKTDQFGAGADIVLGKTGLDLCPVASILAYIVIRGSSPGPFFLLTDGKPLRKPKFVQEVRIMLDALGLPTHQYAGHSFRIGAATSAALAGVEDSAIQLLGRWHSAAFLRYIRTPHDRLATLSRTLAAPAAISQGLQ